MQIVKFLVLTFLWLLVYTVGSVLARIVSLEIAGDSTSLIVIISLFVAIAFSLILNKILSKSFEIGKWYAAVVLLIFISYLFGEYFRADIVRIFESPSLICQVIYDSMVVILSLIWLITLVRSDQRN